MMSNTVDLTGYDAGDVSNDHLDVSGRPDPGQRVEIDYDSSAGGSFNGGHITISGELLYISEGAVGGDSWTFVVHDEGSNRSVAFGLRENSVSAPRIKSLAANGSKRGRKIGTVAAVRFTSDRIDRRAPAMDALRTIVPGDTLMVNGTEYGVKKTREYGPNDRPDKFAADLTTPSGGHQVLTVSGRYGDGITLKRWTEDGTDTVDVDPSTVTPGRYRDALQWQERHGKLGVDGEDTTDAFPAPHGVSEGERVTFTLHAEEGEGSERVSGEVTGVQYFNQTKRGTFSDQEVEPHTDVELDDGRGVKLSDPRPRQDADARAMVKPAEGDWFHTTADDIHPGEGELETDGGEPTKEELDAEWFFNAKVDRPCQHCGHEPTRLSRVRPVFGTPTCSSCYFQRRRTAPAGSVIGSGQRMVTDGGQDPDVGHWEGIPRRDVSEGDRVKIQYTSATRPNREQERTGEVTSVSSRDGFSNFKMDTGEEYDSGEPKIFTVGARGGVRNEGRVPNGRRTIGKGAVVYRWVEPEADGGELVEVVIPSGRSRGGKFHDRISPCVFNLAEPETIPVNTAYSRGFVACTQCQPPTSNREVRADGGVDPEELARQVREAVQDSDVSLDAISLSVDHDGGVTLQGNGHLSREGWEALRDRLVQVLDAGGFQYVAKDHWAFIDVGGLETRSGGGRDE